VTSPVFDAESAAAQVVAALLPLAGPERAEQASRYLKSDLDFLGVSVPGIRAVIIEAPGSDVRRDLPGSCAAAARRTGRAAADCIP
jgi:DNA alkylation repair enzyme